MSVKLLIGLFLLIEAPLAAEGPPPLTLFDFGRGFDRGLLSTSDAEVNLAAAGPLSVRTGQRAEWPGITLKAPEGKWDLASHASIAAEVTNRGTEPLVLHLRVDNPGADGVKNCLTGSITLAPGASGKLQVSLSPTPWRLSKPLDLIGMRGAPGGPDKLDTGNVTQILFFVAKPKADHRFEIGGVRADGRVQTLDAGSFIPFIDEMGQFIHADWPGKTRSVEDLASSAKAEEEDLAAHPGPPDRDRFGGWTKGPALKATGFFRVEKYEGKWWLVDPEGRLFWSHGSDCVRSANATPITDRERYFRGLPGTDSPLAKFFGRGSFAPHGYYKDHSPYRTYDFARANISRKYGEGWEKASAEAAHRRLASWGMNTIANWSDAAVYRMRRTPYVVALGFNSKNLEGSEGYWGKFHDVFDPSFRKEMRRCLEREKGASIGDPWCIGYFVHNELGWGDEVSLSIAALASPPDQEAKKVFLEDLKAKYGTIEKLDAAWGTKHGSWDSLLESREVPDRKKAWGDLTDFYSKTAEAYFKTIREEIAAAAPDQLYMGCRFAWVNDRAARAAAKFSDIVCYNRYEHSVEGLRLPDGIDRPLIIGEFHFGALDRGMFHTGLVPTASQDDRAATYRSYVEGALRNPFIVGTHWFQYQDQATTGRGDGENYQIGLVDICDRPYPETIEACREVGYALYEYRLAGKQRAEGGRLPGPSVQPEGAVLFVDPFDAPPASPWTWIRENAPNHKLDRGLRIRLEPGGLMGGGKDARNILVRPLPPGARSVSVEVETAHETQYEQAGLILYRDDDSYVKLVKEHVDGKTWIVLVVEVDAKPRVLAKVPPPAGTTRIGLDLSAKEFTAFAWGDAPRPVEVGKDAFPMEPAPRIGVFTQGGQPGADRWARFADFRIGSGPCASGAP